MLEHLDSQGLLLLTGLSDRALFWEAQLQTCLGHTSEQHRIAVYTPVNLDPSQQPFEDLNHVKLLRSQCSMDVGCVECLETLVWSTQHTRWLADTCGSL